MRLMGRCPCCRVGTLLLKGEWRAAVMLIMSPRPGDEAPDISAARRRYIDHGMCVLLLLPCSPVLGCTPGPVRCYMPP